MWAKFDLVYAIHALTCCNCNFTCFLHSRFNVIDALQTSYCLEICMNIYLYVLQGDMRDFLNAPNGSSKQSLPVNERLESDSSHSPLGGKTV